MMQFPKMMLTIHGLPIHVKYQDLKTLVRQECNVSEFFFDNLIAESDTTKKVRIALTNEREGSYLMKCLDGFRMAGHVLRVLPVGKSPVNSQSNAERDNGYPQRKVYASGDANYNRPDTGHPMGPANPVQSQAALLNRPDTINSRLDPTRGPSGPLVHPNPIQGRRAPMRGPMGRVDPMQARPDPIHQGLLSRPEGILSRPEGMLSRPEGILSRPEGILSRPEGILSRPEGMLSRPGTLGRHADAIQGHSLSAQGQSDHWNQDSNQWSNSSRPNRPDPQNSYGYQPSQAATFRQTAETSHSSQPFASRISQDGGYRLGPKDMAPGQHQPKQSANVLRSVALVEKPLVRLADPRLSKAVVTISKDNFQGPQFQMDRREPPYQQQSGSWSQNMSQEKQPFPKSAQPFDKPYDRKYPDAAVDKRKEMEYEKGPRFSPRRDIHTTHSRMDTTAGRVREESPRPARYGSPRRDKLTTDKYPQSHGVPIKDVRPAYDAPMQAATQAMYSGGYRAGVHENPSYPPGRPQEPTWQDRIVFAKKEEDRRDPRPKFDRDMEKRSPRASRSPVRRPIIDRSPPRDRYVKHSLSPRSPRRSWALEKRRSPEDAPPPPNWPGPSHDGDYRRNFSADDKKRSDVWERPTYNDKGDRERELDIPDKRFGGDGRVRPDLGRPRSRDREISPRGRPEDRREHVFDSRDPKFLPRRGPTFEADSRRDPKFESRDPKFEPRREPQFEPRRDSKFESRDAKFEPRTDPKFETRSDPKFEPRIDPKFEPRDPKFEPRKDPKFETRDPKFEPRRDPKFEPRDPKFESRDPKFEPRREPKFEPRREPNFEPRVSKFDQREPKFEPRRDPKFEPREPRDLKFEPRESRDPKFEPREPRDPKFEPRESRDPKFEPRVSRDPKFEPRESRDPKFEPRELRDPKFEPRESRDPKFEPRESREPKFEPRREPVFEGKTSRFEPRKDFDDHRDVRRMEIEEISKRYSKIEREPFKPDSKSMRHPESRRDEVSRRDEDRKILSKQSDFNKEFDDVYKRSIEFKQKVDELRRSGERRREDFNSGRDDRKHDNRRAGDDRRVEERKSGREADMDDNRRQDDRRELEWARPRLNTEMKAKREKAIEEISVKIIDRYASHLNTEQTRRVLEELKKSLLKIFMKMFEDNDVSFIEMVVKFNARHDDKAVAKIYYEVIENLPSSYRKRHGPEERNEVPAKTARLSSSDPKQGASEQPVPHVPDWKVNVDPQPVSVMMQQFDIVPQMAMQGMMPVVPSVPLSQSLHLQRMMPVAPMVSMQPSILQQPTFAITEHKEYDDTPPSFEEKDDGHFNLYLCKEDFEPYSVNQSEYLKKFLVNQIIAASESSSGWTPDFTLKGLQSLYRYELVARDEATREWIINLDFSGFHFFNVLVYTKEELWYERAAVWLPGHSKARNIEPLVKLKLQNKYMEMVNIGKWKLVKKIVTAKGTRLYVDMPPSSARALEKYKMMLSYELQKVNVFLKAVAVDKDAFDMGLKDVSVADDNIIMSAIQNSHMPSMGADPNVVKIALKGNKKLTLPQARKIKENLIHRIFKYHLEKGNKKTDFIKFGFCLPGYFAVLPENEESRRWLEHLNLGKLYKHPIVVLGTEDSSTKFIKVNIVVPRDSSGLNPSLILERLKLSNQGVKGLHFALWKVHKAYNTRDSKFSLDVDMDVDSIATLSKMNYKMDYIDSRNKRQNTAVLKYERSYAKLEDLIKKYKDELSDSYDVANMELESGSEDDDIVFMGVVE